MTEVAQARAGLANVVPDAMPDALPMQRRRVVVVDMAVARDSPAGSCVLAEVEGLARNFDVTVFSERCERGALPGVEFVRVRAPQRPVLLRYVAFHAGVPLQRLVWRLRGGRAACVQATQGQLPGADICYAHFCHAAYLGTHWKATVATGPRRWARWATHAFNAWCEARAFAKARVIVVPSRGLRAEIEGRYPASASKLHVIANPVDTARFTRPPGFDRTAARVALGFGADERVLAFMALGDFARKGLGVLLQALAGARVGVQARVRVLVIGGQAGEVKEYVAMARAMNLGEKVRFVGMQADVRPHLWLSDVFAFPSAYEIFSLAILQAAAAGLPVMVTRGLYGAEEFVVDGHNGWAVPRSAAHVTDWLDALPLDGDMLAGMGRAAVASVAQYGCEPFRERWIDLIDSITAGPATVGASPVPAGAGPAAANTRQAPIP